MNTTELERMIVRLLGDGTSYQRMIETAQISTAKAAGIIQFHSQRIETFAGSLKLYGNSARNTLTMLAGLAGVAGVGVSLFDSIRRSASMEQTNIAFEALIGDTKRAKAAIADLTQFAADTPFELPEILGAAKQMIGFGEEAENIVGTMKTLGDVSSALEIPLSSLTYLFGTLKAQGVAHTVDINQFATRGIPIWKQLEQQLGMTNAELRKYIESSKLTFADVEKAFKATTGPMSRFKGMMEKQSQSLNGLFSTLKDNVGMTLTFIGDTLVDKLQLKEGLKGLMRFTDAVRKWIPGAAQLATDAFNTLRDTVTSLYDRSVAKAIEFYQANQQIVHTALAVAAGISGVVVVMKALGLALGIIGFVLGVLKFQQVAGIALWVAWAVALTTVKVIFALFNAQVAILNALWFVASAAMSAYTAGTLASTAATWLLNIAIGVLEAETIVPLIIAVVALAGTLAVIATVGGLVAATLMAVYETGAGLVGVFSTMSAQGTALDRITTIFGEWYKHLLVIIDLAQRDLPAAWEYVKLTFNLMVAQMNQVWPPLWDFVKEGWAAVAVYVGQKFKAELLEALGTVTIQYGKLIEKVNPILGQGIQAVGALITKMGRTSGVGLEEGLTDSITAAKTKLDEALAAGDNAGVQSAQKSLKKFRMEQAVKEWEEWGKEGEKTLVPAAAKTGDDMGAALAKGAIKEVHKFDAALFRSAEGAARLAEYHANLENGVAGKGKKLIPSARNPLTGAVVARQQNPGIEAGGFAKNQPDVKDKYLSQIADSTKFMANKLSAGVILAPANL